MPGFVATVANLVMCSHAGKATPLPLPVRVFLTGVVPVMTLSSPYAIAGCGLSASGTPPCVTGMFTTGSTRVFASIGAGLSPVLVIPNMGTCLPTGQPLIPMPAGQQRVLAT